MVGKASSPISVRRPEAALRAGLRCSGARGQESGRPGMVQSPPVSPGVDCLRLSVLCLPIRVFHTVDTVTLTAGPIARAYLAGALAALDAARTGGLSRGTVSIAPALRCLPAHDGRHHAVVHREGLTEMTDPVIEGRARRRWRWLLALAVVVVCIVAAVGIVGSRRHSAAHRADLTAWSHENAGAVVDYVADAKSASDAGDPNALSDACAAVANGKKERVAEHLAPVPDRKYQAHLSIALGQLRTALRICAQKTLGDSQQDAKFVQSSADLVTVALSEINRAAAAGNG